MHEKLEEQTDALYGIAEFATDGFFDWHIQKDYEYMSPRFWEILGHDPETKKAHPSEWQKYVHPEDLKKTMTLVQEHFDSEGEIPYIDVLRYDHPVEGWIRVLARGKVIKWDGHTPVRMVGTHTLLDAYNGDK